MHSIKKHWSKYSNPKKRYTFFIAVLARQQLKPVNKYPVYITCVWYCKDRRKDPSNRAAGIKFIEDGLVEAGILRNDGFNEIRKITHEFHVDKKNARVEVTLTS